MESANQSSVPIGLDSLAGHLQTNTDLLRQLLQLEMARAQRDVSGPLAGSQSLTSSLATPSSAAATSVIQTTASHPVYSTPVMAPAGGCSGGISLSFCSSNGASPMPHLLSSSSSSSLPSDMSSGTYQTFNAASEALEKSHPASSVAESPSLVANTATTTSSALTPAALKTAWADDSTLPPFSGVGANSVSPPRSDTPALSLTYNVSFV